MNTYDAKYDCMREYLLGMGIEEIRPYVFEETQDLIEALLNAPEWALKGAGTWRKTYEVPFGIGQIMTNKLINNDQE